MRVRYEDIIRNFGDTLKDILRFAEEPIRPEFKKRVDDDTIMLNTNHTISGNPMRMNKGRITFRIDNEWEKKMPKADKLIVTILTSILLTRYGYF